MCGGYFNFDTFKGGRCKGEKCSDDEDLPVLVPHCPNYRKAKNIAQAAEQRKLKAHRSKLM